MGGSKKAKEEDPKEPYYEVQEADDDGDGFGTLSSKMCCTYNGNCYDDSSYNWCNQSSRNCNNCNGVYMSIGGGGGGDGPGCSSWGPCTRNSDCCAPNRCRGTEYFKSC